MVLNVKLASRSLLYGYSCIWTVCQWVFPSIYWPSLKDTKNHHVLLDAAAFTCRKWPTLRKSYGKQIISLYASFRLLQVFMYIIYLTAIIFINLEVQRDLLSEFGITQETELAYKVIYYSPVLQVST